jgi:intracellular septation protein A
LNEIVRRYFSTITRVAFKVWGVTPLPFAPAFASLGVIQRHTVAVPQAER